MKILVLNAGSSSQKSCLYAIEGDRLPDQAPEPLWNASIDWTVTSDHGILTVKANGTTITEKVAIADRPAGLVKMLQSLSQGETQVVETLKDIDIVGHRVVHGGAQYTDSIRITPKVKQAIAQLTTLAPAHNPVNLEGITIVEDVLGDIPQVAVFDTAFHSQMPLESVFYPIPYQCYEQGIQRYGFHGISHCYCAHRAAQLLDQPLQRLKLITCHLGNGCSLAAIRDGVSVNTTMGFTPLDGLMMGSRSGSVDPGILIHLLRSHSMTVDDLDRLLNKESGLQGISGVSSDMRAIQTAIAQGNPRAKLALDLYIHRLQSSISSLLPSLTGLDALIFTAGVGEHSATVREKTCAGLSFLGLKLDIDQNNNSPVDQDIAADDSSVRVLVIHTEEDWAIAQDCWQIARSSEIRE